MTGTQTLAQTWTLFGLIREGAKVGSTEVHPFSGALTVRGVRPPGAARASVRVLAMIAQDGTITYREPVCSATPALMAILSTPKTAHYRTPGREE